MEQRILASLDKAPLSQTKPPVSMFSPLIAEAKTFSHVIIPFLSMDKTESRKGFSVKAEEEEEENPEEKEDLAYESEEELED